MTTNEPSDSTAVLLETLRRFWPAGAEVEVVGRRRLADRSGSLTLSAVPNARAPRVLVPYGAHRAAAGAMGRYNAAITVRETVARLGVGAALRLGATRLLPDHFVVEPGSDRPATADHGVPLSDHLSEILGTRVTFSVGIGNPRVNRKPVLQVFDSSGRSLAFAKVALTAESERDVRAEANGLAEIARAELRQIEAPRLLHAGEWDGAFVLVMSALATSPIQRRRSTVPIAAMAELSAFGADQQADLGATAWWQRTVACGAGIADPELKHAFEAVCQRVLAASAGVTWSFGSWHGDWTPWNMAWARGRVQVWDWERFETGVPVGLDRFHYVANARYRRHGIGVESIHSALEHVLAQDARVNRGLAGLYLLAVLSRYVTSLQRETGELIRDQTMVTLAALEQWIR